MWKPFPPPVATRFIPLILAPRSLPQPRVTARSPRPLHLPAGGALPCTRCSTATLALLSMQLPPGGTGSQHPGRPTARVPHTFAEDWVSLKFSPASCHHTLSGGDYALPSGGPPPTYSAGFQRLEHSKLIADPCWGPWHSARVKLNIGGWEVPVMAQRVYEPD